LRVCTRSLLKWLVLSAVTEHHLREDGNGHFAVLRQRWRVHATLLLAPSAKLGRHR